MAFPFRLFLSNLSLAFCAQDGLRFCGICCRGVRTVFRNTALSGLGDLGCYSVFDVFTVFFVFTSMLFNSSQFTEFSIVLTSILLNSSQLY